MKLLQRGIIGSGIHYSGWPRVMQALRQVASGQGPLLDDFADASFSYQPLKAPHAEPWVGIFHHPISVNSPWAGDIGLTLHNVAKHRFWPESLPWLRGAVTLSREVAAELQAWLNVPVLCIPHPTERNVPAWQLDLALQRRELVQAGFCLRNTQLIYQVRPAGWRRVKLFGASSWYRNRDEALRKLQVRPEIDHAGVEVRERVDNAGYDRLLFESIILGEYYGIAASNLIVECLVRGTPIVVHRLPALEEYLGADYPLFYQDIQEIAGLLEEDLLLAANRQLLLQSQRLPTFDEFATRVDEFVSSLR